MAARGESFWMLGELTLLSTGGPLPAGAGGSVEVRAECFGDEYTLALGRPAREPGAHARGPRAHAVALLLESGHLHAQSFACASAAEQRALLLVLGAIRTLRPAVDVAVGGGVPAPYPDEEAACEEGAKGAVEVGFAHSDDGGGVGSPPSLEQRGTPGGAAAPGGGSGGLGAEARGGLGVEARDGFGWGAQCGGGCSHIVLSAQGASGSTGLTAEQRARSASNREAALARQAAAQVAREEVSRQQAERAASNLKAALEKRREAKRKELVDRFGPLKGMVEFQAQAVAWMRSREARCVSRAELHPDWARYELRARKRKDGEEGGCLAPGAGEKEGEREGKDRSLSLIILT
ncbi:hypothetical protein T492DRAFT_845086 [Pavlovales sp. CCMP2436]|nr:hypothetical protein T492DRAFT_845086 [Pavlovales sp. CCMP2436]